MKALFLGVSLLFAISIGTVGWAENNPSEEELQTVDRVELNQYLGLWYEVFRLPNDFQDNVTKDGYDSCFNTTAEYSLLQDGRISVLNTCFRSHEENKSAVIMEEAQGKARVVDLDTNAKLKVNFTGNPVLEELGVGDGDYWILHLGPLNDENLYSYSLVGAPDMKHLWLLSRDKITEQSVVDEAKEKAKDLGFDIKNIRFSR